MEVDVGDLRISSGVDVAVPPQRAWQVIADFSRNPEWQGGMVSCTWLTEPPVAVGSRYQQEARFLGRAITTTFEVVALDESEELDEPGGAVGAVDAVGSDEPDQRGQASITIHSIASTFPLQVTRTVRPTPDGCRLGAQVAGQPSGWMGWLGPVMRRMVQRSVDADYRRLRELLET